MNRLILILSFWVALIAQVTFAGCKNDSAASRTRQAPSGEVAIVPEKNTVPKYVLEVLTYVRQYREAPQGYVGGRTFENRERRLPLKTADGLRIQYREWDVHPKQRGVPRGAERLVTGSDQSAWFTKDHYKSFIKIDHATH